MSNHQKSRGSESDAELEREILLGGEFTLEEAIGRIVGPCAMKGESPVTRLQQAETEIASWLRIHIHGAGELEVVLCRVINESDLLLKNLDQPPLGILAGYCQRLLESDYLLEELVRNADVEWGRPLEEWPDFEREAVPAHPNDPYIIKSVRNTLVGLLQQLSMQAS